MILSIITINYNNKDGLKKTIESVVTQTETNFEYIIIDGASTDGSAEIIKEYAEHPEYGKKITHWISEPDTGVYNAMNKGIKVAKGEYLHMLNSGDWYEEGSLTPILESIYTKKPDILYTLVNIIQDGVMTNCALRTTEMLPHLPILHQGLIYKSILHKTYGNYDESFKYAADYDFTTKALYNKQGVKTSYVYEPCVNFPLGGLGDSEQSKKEFIQVQVKYGFKIVNKNNIFKKLLKYILPYGLLLLAKKQNNKKNKDK